MWLEHWFKVRKIDWKKWSRYSNMQDEIRSFSADRKIDSKENNVLNKILDYNKRKNRERLLLKRTTKSKLEWLKNISWLSITVRNKITNILNISNRNKQGVINYKESIWLQNKYLWSRWQLRNVNKITLKGLLSKNISKINKLIWNNKNNFSIIDRYWKIYNVFLWRKNWKIDYFYKDWPRKNRRVKIYNWDRLWKYNSSYEKYRNENNKEFNRRINEHNKNISFINSKEFKHISKRNMNFIEKMRLPNNFKKIALKFASKLKSNEILWKNTPITLVDGSRREAIHIINWKKKIMRIIIWENWITTWWYKKNDKKTPFWMIHRFKVNMSKIASSINWNASNWSSHTVKSASLQSTLSEKYWWRYFHWVIQARINRWWWTWWCVWFNVYDIRKMYYDVKKNWWWYGYVG